MKSYSYFQRIIERRVQDENINNDSVIISLKENIPIDLLTELSEAIGDACNNAIFYSKKNTSSWDFANAVRFVSTIATTVGKYCTFVRLFASGRMHASSVFPLTVIT